MNKKGMVENRVKWRNIIVFCTLAYAIFWIPFFGTLSEGQQNGDGGVWKTVFGILGPFSPLIAAVLVRLAFREGFRDARLGFRVKWRYWALAILLPFFWNGVQDGLQLMFGYAAMDWSHIAEGLYRVPINLFGGMLIFIGEEFGWRSYLLERLRPLGRMRALLISGVIWSLWHVPLVSIPNANYGEQIDFSGTVLTLGVFVFAGFIFGWLYLESGSVWPCVLMHSYNNLVTLRLFTEAWQSKTEPSLSANALMALGPIVIVWVILYMRKGFHGSVPATGS